MMNKKGFVEDFNWTAFFILYGLGVVALLIGFRLSTQFGTEGWPIWQQIVIILGTGVGTFFITAKMFD